MQDHAAFIVRDGLAADVKRAKDDDRYDDMLLVLCDWLYQSVALISVRRNAKRSILY